MENNFFDLDVDLEANTGCPLNNDSTPPIPKHSQLDAFIIKLLFLYILGNKSFLISGL